MYDTLEGLNYEKGECSHYVSQILSDVSKAKEYGELKYVPIEDIKVGDVLVKGYSSHLVLDENYSQWAITRRNGKFEEALIIPREVLEARRSKTSRTHAGGKIL